MTLATINGGYQKSKKQKYILFDLINSDLVTLAIDNGARIVCNKAKNNGMFAKDCMITNLYF